MLFIFAQFCCCCFLPFPDGAATVCVFLMSDAWCLFVDALCWTLTWCLWPCPSCCSWPTLPWCRSSPSPMGIDYYSFEYLYIPEGFLSQFFCFTSYFSCNLGFFLPTFGSLTLRCLAAFSFLFFVHMSVLCSSIFHSWSTYHYFCEINELVLRKVCFLEKSLAFRQTQWFGFRLSLLRNPACFAQLSLSAVASSERWRKAFFRSSLPQSIVLCEAARPLPPCVGIFYFMSSGILIA